MDAPVLAPAEAARAQTTHSQNHMMCPTRRYWYSRVPAVECALRLATSTAGTGRTSLTERKIAVSMERHFEIEHIEWRSAAPAHCRRSRMRATGRTARLVPSLVLYHSTCLTFKRRKRHAATHFVGVPLMECPSERCPVLLLLHVHAVT
jgi:hypothetical protein